MNITIFIYYTSSWSDDFEDVIVTCPCWRDSPHRPHRPHSCSPHEATKFPTSDQTHPVCSWWRELCWGILSTNQRLGKGSNRKKKIMCENSHRGGVWPLSHSFFFNIPSEWCKNAKKFFKVFSLFQLKKKFPKGKTLISRGKKKKKNGHFTH